MSVPQAAVTAVEKRARRARRLVMAALFLLSLITYVDRAAISSAKGPIAGDLALSDQAMGVVFSAFAVGYALAQMPAGWFADRIGPRFALSILVFFWSVLTIMTGAVSRFWTLLTIRFFFGIAEAGAFPGSARTFYNWLPARQRGIANGVLFSGGLLGAAFAFPVYAVLLEAYGWRWAFYLLGIPGLLWVACWFVFFRDHPREPLLAEPGYAPAAAVNLGRTLRSLPMVLTMIQYFAQNFTFFIGVSWMYPYLSEHYALSNSEAAGYAMVPLLCGAAANWISGSIVDWLYRSGKRAWSRRLPAISGFSLAVAGVLALPAAGSPAAAVACFALATFGVEMTISPSWAFCMDIGRQSSGALSGAMNMAGNIGAVVSSNLFPALYAATGGPGAYFLVAAALNGTAILCWTQMRSPAGSDVRTAAKPA